MKSMRLKYKGYGFALVRFQEWLDILGYAEPTVYNLPNHIKEFLHWLESRKHYELKSLDVYHFRAYYEHLKSRSNARRGGGLSNAYLNKHLQALERFSVFLRQYCKIELPPLGLIQESSEHHAPDILTEAEVKELVEASKIIPENLPKNRTESYLEAIRIRDRAMIAVFYDCGLRRNEAYHLNVEDIHFERALVHVRKGKNYKERMVPFGKNQDQTFRDYLYEGRRELSKNQNENAFFISERGKRMAGQSLALRLKVLQNRSNHPELMNKVLTPHLLRHSIASHLLQRGMELEKIAQFLGHSSLESTQIYAQLNHDINEQF